MGFHLALTLLVLFYIETCSTTFYRIGICGLKQSPALISMPPGSLAYLRECFRIFVSNLLVKSIYKEPTLSMPGFAFQCMDFCFHPTFIKS
jgi:hypothetical protein